MNSSGRFSLILVSVFAMVWAGLFLGATDASGLRASDNYKFESYTSFPTAGGPYIIAATWDDANNELRVIFNEPLTAATVCPSDFLAIGGWVLNDATSASTVEVIPHANDRRVVTLTNFTTEPDPAAGTDSIAIRTIGDFALPACYQGGITGLDAVVCTDHSHVPIVTGPVAVQVILNTWLEGNASNDQIQVVFDADIDAGIPAGNATGAKFLRTPELEAIGASWSTALTLDVARNGADNNVLDIDIAAAGSVAEIRQLWPGIAKLWMGDDAVEWNGTSVGNVAQKVMFDNLGDHYFSGGANGWNEGGPILLGATWIEADDQMWLIFSEPVDPTSLAQHGGLGEVEAQYELGTGVTGWALNAMNPSQFIDATQGLAWPGEFTNVVIITDPTNGASNSTIRVASTATAMTDFQGMRGPQSEWVDIVPGIAIVRAFYDDMNTSVVSDDVLEMWLTEDIATPANVDHTCFKFANNADLPNSIWSSLSFAADNDDGRGRVRVTGWDLPEELLDLAHATQKRLPLGTYVSLSGAALTGAKSGGTNTTAEIPVIEQPVWPNQPLGAEVPAHTNTFFWDPDGTCQPNYTGDEVNEVYLAWHERVSYKVDSWLLYFTASGVSAFDADGYVNDFAGRALNVSNLVSDSLETNGLHRVAVNIVGHGGAAADVFPTDDPGTALVDGDEVWFMLIPVNYWGDIGPRASAIVFSSRFVGGVCPPRDYSDDDDNLIHVAATWTDTNLDGIRQDSEWTRTVTGDAGAALCGTHIYVFSVPDSTTAATAAEVAVIAADGSFGPVDLENNFNAEPYLYLFAKLDDIYSVGASTGGSVHIINDIVAPSLTVDGTGALVNADRFNNFQVYTKNNYLNILALAKDGTPAAAGALSDLLTIMADFTEVDSATTPTTAQGDLVSAVPLVGLGGDQVDNDGDWVAHDLGIDLNDDGVRDYPEPYFDENGDGLFTPGETFFDRDGDLKCDSPRTGVVPGAEGDADIVYDLNLDSADPDERGWYEVQQWSSAPDSSNCHVTKGFKLRYPITDANLVTNFGEIDDAPVNITVWDSTFAVGLTYADTSTASPAIGAAFKCRIDEVPPTISKLTELFVESSLTASTSTAANLILPTGPTYHLGCYVDFTVETDSDDDCLFGVTQVYTNRTGAWSWEGMTLDPPGVNATAGVPGIIYGGIETGASYATPRNGDDDRDATGLNTDGLDNDEDGDIDEAGEGIDLQDIEVVDAVQDSTTNATAGVDLLWRQTDRRDNDGDAFFRFEPFYDVGGTNPGDGSIQPRMIWYNIDESVTNDIDDDGDGTVDEATEIETYSAAYDDNEDGIMDGEAVEITAVASRKYTVAGAGNFWVTKSAVLGEHPANTVGDICALTEIVEGCYGVLDPNGVENTGTFPTLGWGDDSVTDLFNWAALHSVENIDFYLISQLYGMTADGTTEYQLRMLAYDKAGQTTPGYAYPITFTLDVEPPDPQILAITGACDDDPATAPPDFADVDTDRGGLQVYDSGSYTLTVTDDPDAVKVYFTSRFSTTNGATWSSWSTTAIVGTGIDESRPFTGEYDWWLTHSINNDPAADSLAVEFRAIAEDAFGNTQNADSVCVLDVTVIDGTAPHTWFTMINTVENAYWATYGGASATTVFPYWYRDHYGPVRVPAGPVINIWAEFDDNDDSVPFDATNDVIRLVFEARAVGAGGEWTPIETVTGGIDPASGDSLTIDGTRPVAVTLDTQTMGTGSYDIRVWACDIEGNCSTLSADMATITIVEEGLRAYIEPPYHDPATGAGTFELYAFNYIHDAELDFVEFQFYEDTDGDGVDNDSHSWHKIAIDGDDTGRGDVLLRRGSHKYYDLSGHIAFVNGGGASGDEVFIDFDEDGYSMRDPVIMEQAGGAWGQYDHGIDIVVVGELTGTYDGHATTNFAATEFHTGDAPFDPTEWIMKDNGLEGGVALELWHTQWDGSGLAGEVLVRAVATDEFGSVDDSVTSPSVIPVQSVRIDSDAPFAEVTELTLPDGSTPSLGGSVYISGSNDWFKMLATTSDTDVRHVSFQYSDDGGTNWSDIDLNDDDDFYSDINDTLGFQAIGVDEIFRDDGDFVYGAGDICMFDGNDNSVDTPIGTPLIPLIGEDGPGGAPGDEDSDGLTDEDYGEGDASWDPKDYDTPYYVYFPIAGHPTLPFTSDTALLLRAVATDEAGNVDPTNTATLAIIIGESVPPETDIWEVTNAVGDTIDVWPAVSGRGLYPDGVELVGADVDDLTLFMHVTAEDATAITSVDMMWRLRSDCYPDLEGWENPWRSMSADGYSALDVTYPYNFTVDLVGLQADYGDAVIEFYPMGEDGNGNHTVAPEHPYALRILTNSAAITTTLPATVSPGDEFWFEAELDTLVDGAKVTFYYAERAMDAVIDPTLVMQSSPYISAALNPAMGDTPQHQALLTNNGTACTYRADMSAVTSPTKYDWTMNGASVEFGQPPAIGDTIRVNYDIVSTHYDLATAGNRTLTYHILDEGDSYSPYTVAWDAGDGGVPPASEDSTDAYNIIAAVTIGDAADNECGLVEPVYSEGKLLYLTTEDLPVIALYMFGLNNASASTASTVHQFWPGNPSFDSQGLMTVSEWKMSGIEAEVFVKHDPNGAANPGEQPVAVNLELTQGTTTHTIALAPINNLQTQVNMIFTMYEEDYASVGALYEIENVTLRLAGNEYAMSEVEAGIWQVGSVPVPISGAATGYTFHIDMVGDDFAEVADYRNGRNGISSVRTPTVPFWYASLDTKTLLGDETAIWGVQAIGEDAEGLLGKTSPQPKKMIYDRVAPTVSELTASSLRFNEEVKDATGATIGVTLFADVFDPTPENFNVITVSEVVFQYCPNYAANEADRVWVVMDSDKTANDGWFTTINNGGAAGFDIPDPEADFYDNDGDGSWDEADESTSDMAFRVLARDDAMNFSEPYVLEFILDSTEPVATMTAPEDGSVFAYTGGPITLAAEITESEEDVAYVQFRYMANEGAGAGDGWQDVDITPEDNSDNPWDDEPPYEVLFNPTDYLTEGDSYVRLHAIAHDAAGNEMADDAPEVLDVLIVIDDITAPAAYPMWAKTTGAADFMALADPHTAITGVTPEIRVKIVDPTAAGNMVSKVSLEHRTAVDTAWVLIETQQTGQFTWADNWNATMDVVWDVSGLAEGTYDLRALAYDIDNNVQENPLIADVEIDHTAPSVVYAPMGDVFAGFTTWAWYQNDGVVSDSSRCVAPDPVTEDLFFTVATPDYHVAGINLEYRHLTDQLGVWTAWPASGSTVLPALDYEPNLDFSYDDTDYYVWRARIDNFLASLAGLTGVMEIRAVAQDYALNQNILHNEQNPWSTWTVDTVDPEKVSFSHDVPAGQVNSGDDVTFTFEATDAQTDVTLIRFEYKKVADAWGDGELISTSVPTASNIDTDFPRWTASATWTTPYPLVQDEGYHIRALLYDTAGNIIEINLTQPAGPLTVITVEDNIKPEDTRITMIPAVLRYVDDPAGMVGYLGDCEGGHHDALFYDVDGDGDYASGTDLAVDYGAGGAVLTDPDVGDGNVGVATNTWPRWVNANVIGGTNEIVVANSVFLVARTVIEDNGLERVEFWAINAADEEILIEVDECQPAWGSFVGVGALWQITWDTERKDVYGVSVFPDTTYTIIARAIDLEGNVEDIDLHGSATVTVDNTVPAATPDADPATAEIETTLAVQRNGIFTLFARTESERDDDEVTFAYKFADDLNTAESWTQVPNAEGVDASDQNPDLTRPYVFDWDLNKMASNSTALNVGWSYHMSAQASDIVANTETWLEAFDEERYITFTVEDTMAPVATITEIARATGDTDPIIMPHLYNAIYARDFAYLEATLLNHENDAQHVEFLWALEGSTTRTLIDVVEDPENAQNPYTWRMEGWDLSGLPDGATCEVFAVATDECGNEDINEDTGRPKEGPVFKLVVDHSGPTFTVSTPYDAMRECPAEGLTWADWTERVNGDCFDHGINEIWQYNTGPSQSACGRIAPHGFFTGASDATFEIEMLGAGDAADGVAFRWQKNGAGWTNSTTAVQRYLSDGVWVSFVDGATSPSFTWDTVQGNGNDTFTFTTQGLVYDLLFTSDAIDIDRDKVFWEYKRSELPDGDENWIYRTMNPAEVLYDANTTTFSSSWEMSTLTPGLYDVRLTVYDYSGNRTTEVVAEMVVIDAAAPDVEVTNIAILDPAGDDTVIDMVDFGTIPDITAGTDVQIWATARDLEAGLPEAVETGVIQIIFEAAYVVADPGTADWQAFGGWEVPEGTPITWEVQESEVWHTSGLTDGAYWVRARAKDEVCNIGISEVVQIRVKEMRPPVARINGFRVWTEVCGDDPGTYCQIYALAYCDAAITQVQIELFNPELVNEETGEDGWIGIGIPQALVQDADPATDEVWMTQINLDAFAVGEELTLRAQATDADLNQDPDPATVVVEVVELFDGTRDLMAKTDLGEVTDPELWVVGGDSPDRVVITVTLTDATQTPHVLALTPAPDNVPTSNASREQWVAMNRMNGAEATWQGAFEVPQQHCGKSMVFVTALHTETAAIDLHSAYLWSYETTADLGSNGPVSVPGYWSEGDSAYLHATAEVPSGTAWNNCFMLCATKAPDVLGDDARYLTLIPNSCYHIGPVGGAAAAGTPGYLPTITIQYDEALLLALLEGDDALLAMKEPFLQVRAWDQASDDWSSEHLKAVSVDITNNEISFQVAELGTDRCRYALFTSPKNPPIEIVAFTPDSPYIGRWNYTDQSPEIFGYLNGAGTEQIDPNTITVYIDNRPVAAFQNPVGALGLNGFDGSRVYTFTYSHANAGIPNLTPGRHDLRIEYNYGPLAQDKLESLPANAAGAVFYVDHMAPIVQFHGGWISNPTLRNVAGYMNPKWEELKIEEMLTAYIYDAGAGVRIEEEDDATESSGFKYDLWLIHHDYEEDDQIDVDEIEERLLLHEGTASEVIPYITPDLYAPVSDTTGQAPYSEYTYSYSPSDTMMVGFPIMGGGHRITDGDIIEVTIYSDKHHTDSGGTTGWECTSVDTLWIDPQSGSPVLVYGDCHWDPQAEEYHIYDTGLLDWAGNAASYVEQRFVVDMSAPVVDLIAPAGGSTPPGEAFSFQAEISDRGAGVNTWSAVLVAPDGSEVELSTPVVMDETGVISGAVEDGLVLGKYTLKVTVSDLVGNTAVVAVQIMAEHRVLSLSDAYIYPNPFHPDNGDGRIHFGLSRGATVTVKIYDFAGQYVTTLPSEYHECGGSYEVPWGGTAADGTELANGAYMIRIEANDGSAKKGATVKAVIWRE